MDKHEHTLSRRIAIPVIPKSFRARGDIDLLRSAKKLDPFNFEQTRYILARQCTAESCEYLEAYDLVKDIPEKRT